MKIAIPRIVITTGDPAGIGPEILLKGLHYFKTRGISFAPIVIGSIRTYSHSAYSLLFKPLGFYQVAVSKFGGLTEEKPLLLEPDGTDYEIKPGEGSALSGTAAGRYLDAALEILKKGKADLLLTCPINKKYFMAAGYDYAGHTEYLKDKTGSVDAYMMFAAEKVKVLLLTHHIPLKDVSSMVTKDNLLQLLKFVANKGYSFGLSRGSRIAVAGLNPHAGEDGILGMEEAEEILPAISAAKKFLPNIEGPLPADSLFRPKIRNNYDLIIFMFHDQGLTGVKAAGPSVNITVGLPFIRVSPDHGTAYSIAGKDCADASSFIKAVEIGLDLYYKNCSAEPADAIT